MILALNDADAKVRAIAVRDILASLSKEPIDPAEKVLGSKLFLYQKLISRLCRMPSTRLY